MLTCSLHIIEKSMFYCNLCKTFKNTLFNEHLPVSFMQFENLWGNTYIGFLVIIVKFCFMCSEGKLVSKYIVHCDPIILKWSDWNFWLLDSSGPRPPALSYDPQPWHFCKLKARCLIYFFIVYVNAVALTKLKCQKNSILCHQCYRVLSFSYIDLLYLRTLKDTLTDI